MESFPLIWSRTIDAAKLMRSAMRLYPFGEARPEPDTQSHAANLATMGAKGLEFHEEALWPWVSLYRQPGLSRRRYSDADCPMRLLNKRQKWEKLPNPVV